MSARDADAKTLPAEVSATPAPRLLVVADEAIADLAELPPLVRGVIDRAGEVYVVTPTLPGRLAWLASETNPARHAADKRLDVLLDQLHAIGARADGRAGDDDILTAFADAVADFGPDHILIALRASDHANWQERGLIAHVRERFDLPVTTFALDAYGHVPTRQSPEPKLDRARAPVEHDDPVDITTATQPSPEAPLERDALPVLILFLVAGMIMVAAVWFASAIESWWVIAPVVAVDFILIVGVMISVYRLLDDESTR